jgi:hypothetical protein
MSEEILSDWQLAVALLSLAVTVIICAFLGAKDGDDIDEVAVKAMGFGIMAGTITAIILVFPVAAGVCIFLFVLTHLSMRAGRWWGQKRPSREVRNADPELHDED